MHYGPTAVPVSIVRIATEETFRARSGELDKRTVWHRVAFFSDAAERAHRLIYKGREVMITASLRYQEFVDRDGRTRQAAELIGLDFEAFGDPRSPEDHPPAPTYHLMVDPAIGF